MGDDEYKGEDERIEAAMHQQELDRRGPMTESEYKLYYEKMAIDEMNDRHGKELREFYERKAEEKARLQKENANEEQLSKHEEDWSKQYSELVNNTYNEEKARTDAEAQERSQRKAVEDVIREGKENSDWVENGADENDLETQQMSEDDRLYKQGVEHGYWIFKESPGTFQEYRKDLNEKAAPMSYRDGMDEGSKQATKEKFIEKWKSPGKDKDHER
jgi:hypothetical protein